MPSLFKAMKRLGVDRDGDVQSHLTDLVLDNLKDFMPRESGTLESRMHKDDGTSIRVEGPYARAQFFGVTRKGKPFRYDNLNPKGGSHWDRRMVAERGRKIVAQMNRYVRKR
jgi:hypothetical protein